MKFIKSLSLFIIFLFPFYFLRLKIGFLPTNFIEILIGIDLLACLFFLRDRKTNWQNWLWPGILLLAALFSAVISPEKTKALGILKGWFFFPIIFGWIISFIYDKKDLLKISLPIYVSMIVISLWALGQKFGYVGLFFYQKGDPTFGQYLSSGRFFGPFESPNYLAMFLVPISFLALSAWSYCRYKWSKILFSVSFILPLLAIYFSGSRAGLIALSVAILFFATTHFFQNKKLKQYLLPAVFAIVIGLLASTVFKSDRLAGDEVRKEIYSYSIDLVKEHPFFGVGLGNYQNSIKEISKDNSNFTQWGLPYALHPHNLFLSYWLNLGLIGLIAFIIITIHTFFLMIKHKSSTSFLYASALVAVLIHGLFDTTYFKNDLSLIFWLIYGLTFWNNRNE